MKELLKMGGDLSSKFAVICSVIGLILFFGGWQVAVSSGWIESRLLPSPAAIISAFPDLVEQGLWRELWYSIRLNLMSYVIAMSIALPLGFLIGLSPIVRGLTLPFVQGAPYLPLTAATAVFILWFGIENTMKISFLAFAIFVYLLPTTINRVMETRKVYINTAKTLGANNWQIITKVYIPDALARVWDDIVVLVAISWTYIVIVELINKTGGVGAMAYMTQRISRPDMLFGLLFTLMCVGFIQDRLFRSLGNIIFPHKKVR